MNMTFHIQTKSLVAALVLMSGLCSCVGQKAPPVVPQGPMEDLSAKVGEGGILVEEYEAYKRSKAHLLKKSRSMLTIAELQETMLVAIDDELLFQAAMAAGWLNDPEIKEIVTSAARSRYALEFAMSSSRGAEEIEAFYNENRELFMTDASVRVKARRFVKGSDQAEVIKYFEEAKADPSAKTDWVDMGWVQKGSNRSKLPMWVTDDLAAKGKTAEVVLVNRDSVGVIYVFWVIDQTEPESIPLEKCRTKVRNAMNDPDSKEFKDRMTAELRKKYGSLPKAELYRQFGLERGFHRFDIVRNKVISKYLKKKGCSRKQALLGLRKRFPVEILDETLNTPGFKQL